MSEHFPRGIGRVTARFVRKSNGQPLSGITGQHRVKLFDKDVFKDDTLGEPRLGADGRVTCTFDLQHAVSADSPMETKPDVYLVVYEGEREIFRTPTFGGLDFTRRDDKGEVVTHDLGTFQV
jgi:hypothetical protein